MSMDVPLISITQERNDDDYDDDDGGSRKMSLNDCHTDIESIDEEEQSRKNSMISSLRKTSSCNGAVTDIEECVDSGEEGAEQEKDFGPEISVYEFLDLGTVDESSSMVGNDSKKRIAMKSMSKCPNPNEDELGAGDTDDEHMEASGDEADVIEEMHYSDDDKPIVLEDASSVDIKDVIGKWKKAFERVNIMKRFETKKQDNFSSSDSDVDNGLARLKTHKFSKRATRKCEDNKSDVENIFFSDEDKKKTKCYSIPTLETPDVEVMLFDEAGIDERKDQSSSYPELRISFAGQKMSKGCRRKTFSDKNTMLALPGNDDEGLTDVENLESSDDEDNGNKNTKCKNFIPIAIMKNDALTDVEDFNDSGAEGVDYSEGEHYLKKSGSTFGLPSPVREYTCLRKNKDGEPVMHTTPLPDYIHLGFEDYDADKGLTDVENFSADDDISEKDDAGNYSDDDKAIVLEDASSVEIKDVVGKWKKAFERVNIIKRFETRKHESTSPSESDDKEQPSKSNYIASDGLLSCGLPNQEPKTDTEDIFINNSDHNEECRRRRTKTKHSSKPKSSFLQTQSNQDAGTTDVEDINMSDDDPLAKDNNFEHRRGTIETTLLCDVAIGNIDGKSDVEYLSCDDNINSQQFIPDRKPSIGDYNFDNYSSTSTRNTLGPYNSNQLNSFTIPIIQRNSPTPEHFRCNTDTEDMQINSEDEDNGVLNVETYSRAQTSTPMQLTRDLNESGTSEIHEINSGLFDTNIERINFKGNRELIDELTDVELIDDDVQMVNEN